MNTVHFQQSRHNQSATIYSRMSVKEGVLLGLGNPLLDITINTDESFLKKYNLLANNAIEADPSHQALFDEIVQDHNPIYLAGEGPAYGIRGGSPSCKNKSGAEIKKNSRPEKKWSRFFCTL